ncbi:hypothetical protein D0C36_11720 [Mucilaginibacter conchicola]|uniref:Uncharacterized protein n=1 Tax=Mucilaginibacter conchicola TaxID=2303333 RepID=A0A372NU35_9SPHI|nr:hypothetical protein [Mucilaginibacter conchicola]RFZ92107.1 hypothetical protein D0C36_11720 [Mucilaginibacter conchicola]
MIVQTDKEYSSTKMILQGKASIGEDFKSLADWINDTYQIRPINIEYDMFVDPEGNRRPRLNVIFKFWDEQNEFSSNESYFDSVKQAAIKQQFEQYLRTKREKIGLFRKISNWLFNSDYHTKDMFVIFISFEMAAKADVNNMITSDKLEILKSEIDNSDIWKIERLFDGACFIFYNTEQANANSQNSYADILAERYYDLLKSFDEFDFFKRSELSIILDSKENLDKNYHGNLKMYLRRVITDKIN